MGRPDTQSPGLRPTRGVTTGSGIPCVCQVPLRSSFTSPLVFQGETIMKTTSLRTLRTLRTGLLSTVLALLLLCVFALGASAHAVPASHAVGPDTSVTVKIIKTMSGFNFNVHKVTVTQGETATLCNKTAKKQVITYQGFNLYTIAAKTCQSETVNFPSGSYTVSLKSNANASLTIVVQ